MGAAATVGAQAKAQHNTTIAFGASTSTNVFNELSRIFFRPTDTIIERANHEINRVRQLRSRYQAKNHNATSDVRRGSWRRTAAVIGVQIRGAMLCDGPYSIVGHKDKGDASACFRRFDWTSCVRRLQVRAKEIGYSDAHVYLATESFPLRLQAERAFGSTLADPPSNRGAYNEKANQGGWQVALQELVTLARADAFVYFSKEGGARSDSTYAQTAASWAAGRQFEVPEVKGSGRRPFLGVFTVTRDPHISCNISYSAKQVEPFGHVTDSFVNDHHALTNKDGLQWHNVGQKQPLNTDEVLTVGALPQALASGQLNFDARQWASFGIDQSGLGNGRKTVTVFAAGSYFQPSRRAQIELKRCNVTPSQCVYPSFSRQHQAV